MQVVTARSHDWLCLAPLKPRLWWQCDCFQVPMSSHLVPDVPGPSIWFISWYIMSCPCCSWAVFACRIKQFVAFWCDFWMAAVPAMCKQYPDVSSSAKENVVCRRCRHSRPRAGLHGHAGLETMWSVKCCTPKNPKNMTNIQCIYSIIHKRDQWLVSILVVDSWVMVLFWFAG